MVTIVVPSVWTTDHRSSFHVAAGPLPEILRRFVELRPECEERIIGPDGSPFAFINVAIDNCLVPRDQRDSAVVAVGSVVTLLSPMAGG